ncbi:hypothetical protein [Rhizobium herbae]
MSARASLLVLVTALVVLLFLVPSALFLIFGGILLAVLLNACGDTTARFIGLPPAYGLAIFLLV